MVLVRRYDRSYVGVHLFEVPLAPPLFSLCVQNLITSSEVIRSVIVSTLVHGVSIATVLHDSRQPMFDTLIRRLRDRRAQQVRPFQDPCALVAGLDAWVLALSARQPSM